MTKYIDADKLTAKIEGLKERYGSIIPKSITAQNYQEGRLIGYEDALYEIKKSLQHEQSEVDLEKEIDKEWAKCEPIDEGMGLESANIVNEQFDSIARHFYELGLNARNEE